MYLNADWRNKTDIRVTQHSQIAYLLTGNLEIVGVFYLVRKGSSQLKVEEFFPKYPVVQNSSLCTAGTTARYFYPSSVSAKPWILFMLLRSLTSSLSSKCVTALHPTLLKWWVFQVSSNFMLLPLVSPAQHTQLFLDCGC